MSTKIYKGYKINVKSHQILAFCQKYHKEISPILEQILNNKIFLMEAKLAVFKLMSIPHDERAIIEQTHKMLDNIPVKYEIAIFPRENDCLAIFYGNHIAESIFKGMEEVEYYGYWDNADPPDDMTDKEWEFRRREWEFIDYRSIIEQALVWTPFPDWYYSQPFCFAEHSLTPDEVRTSIASAIAEYFVTQELDLESYNSAWEQHKAIQDVCCKVVNKIKWLIPPVEEIKQYVGHISFQKPYRFNNKKIKQIILKSLKEHIGG